MSQYHVLIKFGADDDPAARRQSALKAAELAGEILSLVRVDLVPIRFDEAEPAPAVARGLSMPSMPWERK